MIFDGGSVSVTFQKNILGKKSQRLSKPQHRWKGVEESQVTRNGRMGTSTEAHKI